MSAINLNVEQLQTLSSEIAALDTALIQNYLPELESELAGINNNIQGEELNNIVTTIITQFTSVKDSLQDALPKLEEFLEQQLKTYAQTEETLKEDLTQVLNKMANIAGITSLNNGSTKGETAREDGKTQKNDEATNAEIEKLKKEMEELKKENKELSKSSFQKENDEIAKNFKNDGADWLEDRKQNLGNVADGWSNGLLPGVWETGMFLVDSTVDSVLWGVDQVGAGVDWALSAIGLDPIGDLIDWIL